MKRFLLFSVVISISTLSLAQNILYHSKDFTITNEKVMQGGFEAKAVSPTEINSSYKSIYKKAAQNKLEFKFSLNGMDNERGFAQNHQLTLTPVKGKMISSLVVFGEADTSTTKEQTEYLNEDVELLLRVDMRHVLKDFKEKGHYELFNGDKFYAKDFSGVFIAGNISPLSWDFQTLGAKKQFQLSDENNDGIYEIKLLFKKDIFASDEDKLTTQWKLTKDISAYPQLQSSSVLLDALYNQAIEEMLLDVRDDGAFMAGEKWLGIWTRDISYSIQLAFAIVNPDAAKTSLLAKVKDGKIIQDTGTGGAWPVSSDRMTWALAAWEIYKVTGDKEWLKKNYSIIKTSALADLETVRDKQTGLFNGESSFLDWREQTYPLWMDPKDIYTSKNLGTNAVHFQTYKILTAMASELHEDASELNEDVSEFDEDISEFDEDISKFDEVASKLDEDASRFISAAKGIQDGMNKLLWLPEKKYFGQYLYGRNYQSLSPKSEALGEALSVLFEIPNAKRQKEIVENTPVTKFGIPCVYPQTPNIPPYHNDAVWAFVQAYWTMASAKVKNETSVEHGLASLYRAAALFLTNKENFVATTGDYVGTQINSNRQLWSVAGNLAMTYRVFFGMQFEPEKLIFSPFIPKNFAGERALTNFKYRNAQLTISVKGFGDGVKSFALDGKILKHNFIEASLEGKHSIEIIMNGKTSPSKINLVENEYAPETPKVTVVDGKLTWDKIPEAGHYLIYKNGLKAASTKETSFAFAHKSELEEYQVKAVDKNNVASFLSEPVTVNREEKIIEIEDCVSTYDNKYANYSSKGYVKIEKQDHRDINFTFTAETSGLYTIDFRYSNGNGPINTDNKCAIRSLMVDNQFAGAIVMPHRGENSWNVFNYSNPVQIHLAKGEHFLTLTFRNSDDNMNGEVNGALLDCARISLLK